MMTTGRVRVLGPARLDVAAGPVELSGRQRAVLAALALHTEPQDSEALIPLVWGDDPPRTARAALQNAIAAIRARSDDPHLVTTDSRGYRLGPHVEIDAFEAAADAAAVLRSDPHAATPDVVAKLLADWGPVAFADLAPTAEVEDRRAVLRRTRDAVIDHLGAALIATGRLDEAIATLQSALIDQPERQPRVGLLAIALHRNGASADAVRVLDLATQGAIRSSGMAIAPALSGLEARILDGDPSLLESAIIRELRHDPSRVSRPDVFWGRQAAIEQISPHLDCASSVLITGAAGNGKSALLSELARRRHETVVAIRCAEGPASPYEPVLELVGALAAHPVVAPHFETAVAGCDRAALSWVLPDLAAHLEIDEALPRRELRRERADAALVQLLGEIAASVPVVFIVDDLHQAPAASLHVVVQAAATTPACVVAARRPRSTNEIDPTIFAPVQLDAMDETTVRSLLADALDEPDIDAVATAAAELLHHTGGNALFLVSTIRHLHDVGAFRRVDGRWRISGDIDVPPTVEAAVALQLGRLSARTRAAVDVVAVAGDPIPTGIVARLCGPSTPLDVVAAADEGLLVEAGDRVRPVHQLVADAICGLMSEAHRLETHDRLASTLASLPDSEHHLAAIALHRFAARSLDPGAAIDALTQAGHAATAAQSHEFAVGYYRQALDMLGTEATTETVEIATALGAALRDVDDEEQIPVLIGAASRARDLARPDLVAKALIELGDAGKLAEIGDVNTSVVDLLDHALAHVDDPSQRARLQANASIWFAFSDDWQRCYDLWASAAQTAEEIGDRELLCDVYRLVDQTNDGPDQLERRAEVVERLRRLGDELDDGLALWRAHLASYGVAAQRGTMQELAAAVEGMAALEPAVFNGRGRLNLAFFQAGLAQVRGDLAGCEAIMASTEGLPNPFSASWDFIIKAAVTFVLQRERDGLAELDPISTALVDAEPGPGAWRVMSAVTAHAAGDDDRARQRLHDIADVDFSSLALDMTYILALVLAGEVAVDVDELEIAGRVGQRLMPYTGRASWTGYFIYGPVDLTLARIADSQDRTADAADHLDVALSVSERLEAPIFVGRTLARMAELASTHPELAARWPGLDDRLSESTAAAKRNDWIALRREIAEATAR